MFDRLRAFWNKEAKPVNMATSTTVLGKEQGSIAAITSKQQGDQYLEKGDVARAMPFYEKAIEIDPHNGPALVKAGFCLRELGREVEAEQLIRRALSLTPDSSDAHYLLSTIARSRGDVSQAIDELFSTLQCDPAFEVAYPDLCFLLYQAGRIEEAKKTAQSGLERFSQSADLHFCLGNIELAEKQWDAAASSFHRALGFAPHHAFAYVNLSLALQERELYDQALDAIDHALAISQDVADWHLKRGYILQMQSQFELANAAYRSAIALQPDFAKAYANLGSLQEQDGQLDFAVANYRKAVELAPEDPNFLFNLGAGLQAKRDFDAAETCYQSVLQREPAHAKALINMAAVMVGQGRDDEALAFFDIVFERLPDMPYARMNKAYLLLRLGRFREGWPLTEYRWQCEDGPFRPALVEQNWLGKEDVQGKTVLIYGEQGFGDMLHFIRYTKLLAQRGATVYLQLPMPLKSLAETCPGVTAVFADGEQLPPFDFSCAMMSLPMACNTEVDTIPDEVPYLHGDQIKTAAWDQLLGERKTLRVGLAWAGDPRSSRPLAAAMDRTRSMHFERLLPLLEMPGITFVSLQVGEAARRQMKQDPRILDYTTELRNFHDTASLIESLDLVISVDTSIVHLSGALAKRVWMMDRFGHCYRWFPNREDSPWYPTMRIFRQEVAGDWDGVVLRIKRELERLVASLPAAIADG